MGKEIMNDQRIGAILKIQELHIQTLLQFHTEITAVRLEVESLKKL